MKKIAALLLLICASSAYAYDDEVSTDTLIRCMRRHQHSAHFSNSFALASSCQKEMTDFTRYNCDTHGLNPTACTGAAVEIAGVVLEQDCNSTPGCSMGAR